MRTANGTPTNAGTPARSIASSAASRTLASQDHIAPTTAGTKNANPSAAAPAHRRLSRSGAIKAAGVTDGKLHTRYCIYAGIIAATCLGLVYVSLWAARTWFHTDPYAVPAVTKSRAS